MDPKIEAYISKQSSERKGVLTAIHNIITEKDKTVFAIAKPMMGKEMIVYKGKGFMKYGLASIKNYRSLHVMPIYGSGALYTKYKSLLQDANFQKGCINFKNENEMPLIIVKQLIADCSNIDLIKIKEEYIKAKKLNKPK